jgi:hypothetical protein
VVRTAARAVVGTEARMAGQLLRLERRHHAPLPATMFTLRLALYFVIAASLLAGSLLLGMWGYVHFEGLSRIDAFLNAAMLLGGMGPVTTPQTTAGKLFAGAYALYAGIVFLISAGVLLAPVVHRALHLFHVEQAKRAADAGN